MNRATIKKIVHTLLIHQRFDISENINEPMFKKTQSETSDWRTINHALTHARHRQFRRDKAVGKKLQKFAFDWFSFTPTQQQHRQQSNTTRLVQTATTSNKKYYRQTIRPTTITRALQQEEEDRNDEVENGEKEQGQGT